MRKLFVIAVAILAICFSACQREFLPDDNNPNSTGTFRAKIDGVQWEALNVKTATRQADVIVLLGSTSNNKTILLRVADSGVHNYSFHTQSMSNVAAFVDSTENPYAYATNQWEN